MSKKCIYCKTALEESSVVDICRNCGLQVWGKNMFNAIVQNMENARQEGDLYQGSVSTTPKPEQHLPTSHQIHPFSQAQQSPIPSSFSTPQSISSTSQLSSPTPSSSNPNPSVNSPAITNSHLNPLSSLISDAIKTQQDLLEESKNQQFSQEQSPQIIESRKQREEELIFS